MNPQELKETMRLRRETAQMVREYWAEMMPKLGEIPEPQLQGWLSRFDLDTMIEGINAAMIVRSKQDAAGKKTSVQDAVNYASGAMNKLRPADPEKTARISAARSRAGKIGRAKQLSEFAQSCPDLPKVAQPLPPAYVYGFGSGFDVASAVAVDCDDEVALLPRHRPEVPQSSKSASDGVPYPQGFDDWFNADRITWLADHSHRPAVRSPEQDKIKTNPRACPSCGELNNCFCGMEL